jgi:hypothetical protein
MVVHSMTHCYVFITIMIPCSVAYFKMQYQLQVLSCRVIDAILLLLGKCAVTVILTCYSSTYHSEKVIKYLMHG